jgi:palmitoyltransferase
VTNFRSRYDFGLEGKQYLDAKAQPEDVTPLMIAAFYGNAPAVDLFLANGADPNSQDTSGNTAAHYSAQVGSIDAPKSNRTYAPPTVTKKEGFLGEIRKPEYTRGDLRVMEALRRGGMDPNLPNFNGKSPLHYAATFGRTKLVQILLEAGASQFKEDAEGLTPIDLARVAKQDKLVLLMV